MKSNKCLFSKAVFKSDILRFLPFAAPLLIAELIVYPLTIFNNYSAKNKLAIDDFATIGTAGDFIGMLFAGVMALLVFSYLFNANKCNAIHGFPIGRKGLFFTSFCAAYVLTVVPQLIAFAAGVPSILETGVQPLSLIILQTVSIFGITFVALSIAVVAVMLSGNMFSAAVIYGILNLFVLALNAIAGWVGETFGLGIVSSAWNDKSLSLSPLAIIGSAKLSLGELAKTSPEKSFKLFYFCLAVYIGVSLLILLGAYILYKFRKLECAGDMVAFKAEIPVFSVIVSIFGGAFADIILTSIFSFGLPASIICYFAFAFIFFFAAQMVLKKSARVFGAKQLCLWIAASVISVVIALIGNNYASAYTPTPERVERASVYTTYDMEITDKYEIGKLIQLNKDIIQYQTKNAGNTLTLKTANNKNESETVYDNAINTRITYFFKNGKIVTREYLIRKEDEELHSRVKQLEEEHRPDTVFDLLDTVNYKIERCEYIKYSEEEATTLRGEECEKLFELCKADMNERAANYYSDDPDLEGADYGLDFYIVTATDEDTEKLNNADSKAYDFTGSTVGNNDFYEDSPKNKNEFTVNIGELPRDSKTLKELEKINNK